MVAAMTNHPPTSNYDYWAAVHWWTMVEAMTIKETLHE